MVQICFGHRISPELFGFVKSDYISSQNASNSQQNDAPFFWHPPLVTVPFWGDLPPGFARTKQGWRRSRNSMWTWWLSFSKDFSSHICLSQKSVFLFQLKNYKNKRFIEGYVRLFISNEGVLRRLLTYGDYPIYPFVPSDTFCSTHPRRHNMTLQILGWPLMN